MSISYLGCSGENPFKNVMKAEDCFQYQEREACFYYLFSVEGPKRTHDTLVIEDEHNVELLCDELFKKYKDDSIKYNLFNIARINNAKCTCNYIEYKFKEKHDDADNYRNYYDKLCVK